MPTLNEDLLDRAVDSSVDFTRYNNGVVRRLIAALNKVDKDLFEQLTAALDRLPAESFTVDRLDALLQSVRMLNESAYTAMSNELGAELKDLVAFESSYQLSLFKNVLPVQVVVAAVNVEQVYSAALSRPMQGRLMKEWAKSLEADKMTRIRDALRMGYVENQTVGQMVTRLRGTQARGYEDGLLEIDRRAAAAVVRTATAHTANFTRQRFYEANESIIKGLKWCSTLDSRTSPVCRARDGQVFPVNSGPRPPAHWNCLPGDSLVLPGSRVTGAFERWFDGELVIIKTASGRELSSTPNHPILTSGGWVASGVLNVGGDVICNVGGERAGVGDGDHQNVPSRIQDVVRSFFAARQMITVPVPTTPEDFHGDGGGSKIAVVATESLLRDGIDSASEKHVSKIGLVDGRLPPATSLVGAGHLFKAGVGSNTPPGSGISERCESFAFFGASSSHTGELLLGSVASGNPVPNQDAFDGGDGCACSLMDSTNTNSSVEHPDYLGISNSEVGHRRENCRINFASGRLDAVLPENSGNYILRNSERCGDFRDGSTADKGAGNAADVKRILVSTENDSAILEECAHGDGGYAALASNLIAGMSCNVLIDEIVSVERVKFSGHVYNLETADGWYIANGIITHNCRSTMAVVTKSWREMGIDMDELPASTRASMNGQVPEDVTYQDWLRKQTAARQDDILGKSKGLLFRNGGLTLDRFIDRQGRELTLVQLREKHADAFARAGL